MEKECKYPDGWKWPNPDKWPYPEGPNKVKMGANYPTGWKYPSLPRPK